MTPFVIVRALFLLLLISVGVVDYFLDVHLAWYLLLTVLYVIFLFVGSASMKFNIFLKAYTKPANFDNKIAITFDDGPTMITAEVLDVLKRYKAKASFFCIGKNIEERPDVVKRQKEEGHVLGNHSYSHNKFFSFFGRKRLVDELKHTNNLIENITGDKTQYFRPPYGVTNPAIAAALKKEEMKVVGWDIRSFDTAIKNPQKVINRVLSRLKPGSVILLHDNLPDTPEILEAILLHAKGKNYSCVTVEDIFNLT